MASGTYQEFLDALRAFESGWDRDRYEDGVIQDWQLDEWAGGQVSDFYPDYASWGDLTDAEWNEMSYRSMNSLGFVGYQFGEALLIDLGYYEDDVFYGAGASSNTWDGTWTGKNGVNSLDDFMTAEAQEIAIREAFGYNLSVIVEGLENQGQSLDDHLGSTRTYTENGQQVTVTLTLTGILAAAHLRGAWGTLNLLLNDSVSTDEYGTSILRYIDQFGGYDSPTTEEIIQVWDDSYQASEGSGDGTGSNGDTGGTGDTGGNGDTGDTGDTGDGGPDAGNGTAGVNQTTADVVITWAWGTDTVIPDFDPATDTVFVDWIGADALEITETAEGVEFAVPSNNQTTTLTGVTLADLSAANFTILDDTAAAEILGLVGSGSADNGGGTGNGGHSHMHLSIALDTPGQTIDGFMPEMGDVIDIGADIYADNFAIFEESGDALGTTVRIEITDGGVTKQIVLTGFGLDALSLANFSIANQGVFDEVSAAIGSVVVAPPPGEGYVLTYDSDGSNPPDITGASDTGGVTYRADSNADDIVGFRAGVDALDFGDTSVHGMIITKSLAGEIVIDNPWSESAQIVQGVTYQDVTIDDFGTVGNEHFRQDMGAVISWEQNVGPRDSDTVYIRSHEYGSHQVIDGFDPTSMKISFLYFGTRERLTVEDTDAGMVISSLPSGQSFTFTGVTKADLVPGLVEFHFDQVMEDNLEVPFGFDQNDVTLVDRTVLLTPEAPAGASTDGSQTRTGDMTGSIYEDQGESGGSGEGGNSGGSGAGEGSGSGGSPSGGSEVAFVSGSESFVFGWSYGTTTTIVGFDETEDSLDFGSFSAEQLAVSEQSGDLIFEVLGNGGDFVVVQGIQAEDLSTDNLTAPSWNGIVAQDSQLMVSLVDLGMEWV